MARYHVLFYKNLLSSDGHNFKCLERQIDVQSDSPSGALILAEQNLAPPLDADTIEVIHVTDSHPSCPSSHQTSVHGVPSP